MKRLMYGILAGVICLSSVDATTHTNKTFLMPRSHNENLAMQYAGWHKQVRKIDESKWGSSIQITGFYQELTNHSDLGNYFGKYNSATGPNTTNPYADSIQDFIWVKDRPALATSPMNNEKAFLLESRTIIHDIHGLVTSRLDTKGFLRPKQTSYGVTFDWNQKLDKLTEGLYFRVSVPVVHSETDMLIGYTGDHLSQTIPGSTGTVTLADYLSGSFEITGTQSKLTHAKINGERCKTGVADVSVKLGYNFLYKEQRHFGVNLALMIPTNDGPSGEWLFNPELGYAGHWALGMGLDCAFELWKNKNKSLDFIGAVDYKYLFNKTECRTLGVKFPDNITDTYQIAGKVIPMAHYMLGGEAGKKGVFPLANVLTREVGVEPGSRIELLAGLAFNWGKLTIDAGYNLFAKESENVTVKCWPEHTYAFASPTYDPITWPAGTDNLFTISRNGYDFGYEPQAIQATDLVTASAETPVYVTHKVYLGATYGTSWKYPMIFGLGGSWEFVNDNNAALEGWNIWLKTGISF